MQDITNSNSYYLQGIHNFLKTKQMTTEKNNDVWKLIAHSHQIADTGDYDGCYEVTNGKVSLFTKDDDDEAIEPVVKTLNESGVNFYIDDSDKWELQAIKDENKRLHFMIENGLGWDDMKNDIAPSLF